MVGILEKVDRIQLKSVSASCECKLLNYGAMIDGFSNFTYDFKKGNIYGVIDEFGLGGWALSYVLAGKCKLYQGEVIINNKAIDNNVLQNFACYVGEDGGRRKLLGIKSMTVREQILMGIHTNKSFCNSYQQIQSLFGLSNERVDRKIELISGERWKASMAIGYAWGKSIYCFPWLNYKYMRQLEAHIKLCMKPLIEVGAIIIIPTSDNRIIRELANDVFSIENMQ